MMDMLGAISSVLSVRLVPQSVNPCRS